MRWTTAAAPSASYSWRLIQLLEKVDKLAESGHEGAKALATYYVGQAVGLMNVEQSARSVVYEFMQDYADAVDRLSGTLEE